MEIYPYGQADYYYAVSQKILSDLIQRGLISEEQRKKIDNLNKQKIFSKYPSIADLEVRA